MIAPGDLAAALGMPGPTDEQAAVIAAPLAPTLVIAGAGSGKTETMAARVLYLVANRLVRPEQILGLTFTRKAAAALSARIRHRLRALANSAVLPAGTAEELLAGDPEISTYHAFGGRLIAEFGPLAGLEPAARVLSVTGSWQLARRVVGRWDGDLRTDLPPERVTEDVLAIAGSLADHLATADDLRAALERLLSTLTSAPRTARQHGELRADLREDVRKLTDRMTVLPLVQAYGQAKRAAGVIDFADQMQVAAELVTAHPRVAGALRSRYPVVLLDEYQDTGHAQRVILRSLFGAAGAPGHAVTAVGDPVQSIYGWRGASASNLPRFATDFPAAGNVAAARLPLLTSFRNPQRVLDLANAMSEPIRDAPVPVGELRARSDARAGRVQVALLATTAQEDAWVARRVADRWRCEGPPPTTAVLLRRRADMAGMAAALRAEGLPVEVVGVGGLLDEPEVADLVATLRVMLDHDAGPAAVRLLTGARWRLGIADLAALARRGRELAPGRRGTSAEAAGGRAAVHAALSEISDSEDTDSAGLVDALADPGPADRYSAEGFRRIGRFAAELRRLRARLGAPLPDLLAEIEHAVGLDLQASLGRGEGRAHLAAFADVVAGIASTGAGPVELLDHLAAAAEREDGLAPGAVDAAAGRVQVLTIHAAKGLEWELVAVPHLSAGVFPNTRTSTWLGDSARLPPEVRGDRDDLPELALPAGGDQKEMADALSAHVAALKVAQLAEERRLLYVALTRSEESLMLSAHHWAATTIGPRGPGEFFTALAALPAAGQPDVWAEAPGLGATNPMTSDPRSAAWPVDPLGARRDEVQAGAALVLAALAVQASDEAPMDPSRPAELVEPARQRGAGTDRQDWDRDVGLLLAERATASRRSLDVALPGTLSVSQLVDLAADPEQLARRLRRPVPAAPTPQARRGTAFHAWLQRRFDGGSLLDLDDLPGADERDAAADGRLAELVAAFSASVWASRTPAEVEVPFATRIAGLQLRGRIDAVYRDAGGGMTVVDWKTGQVPTGPRASASAVQLAVYRLAMAELAGIPLDRVRAVFHYVTSGETVDPVGLLDADGLAALVAGATVASGEGATGADRPGEGVAASPSTAPLW